MSCHCSFRLLVLIFSPGMGKRGGQEERVEEYARRGAVWRLETLGAATDEGQVWSRLGSDPTLRVLRKEFLAKFMQQGFGWVQGSKYACHLKRESYKEETFGPYATRAFPPQPLYSCPHAALGARTLADLRKRLNS